MIFTQMGGVNDELLPHQCLLTIGRDSPRRRDLLMSPYTLFINSLFAVADPCLQQETLME